MTAKFVCTDVTELSVINEMIEMNCCFELGLEYSEIVVDIRNKTLKVKIVALVLSSTATNDDNYLSLL